MLDSNVRTRIREYISAELRPRQRTLGIAIRDRQQEFALSGAGGLSSSGYVLAVADACRNELTVRARMIWSAVQRSHTMMVGKVDPQTLEDLQQQLEEYVTEHANAIAAQACERVKGDGKRAHEVIRREVSERQGELIERLNVEAQFYVDALRAQEKRSADAPGGMVFNAPVGAVQTGAYATVHVSLSGPESDRLLGALERLRQSLSQNGEIESEQRRQADELVGDLLGAVKAETPNPPRIAGLLGGLAQTVRTVASLRPAWETVRDAAASVGLPIL